MQFAEEKFVFPYLPKEFNKTQSRKETQFSCECVHLY